MEPQHNTTRTNIMIVGHLWHRRTPRQRNKLPKISKSGYSCVRRRNLQAHDFLEGIKVFEEIEG